MCARERLASHVRSASQQPPEPVGRASHRGVLPPRLRATGLESKRDAKRGRHAPNEAHRSAFQQAAFYARHNRPADARRLRNLTLAHVAPDSDRSKDRSDFRVIHVATLPAVAHRRLTLRSTPNCVECPSVKLLRFCAGPDDWVTSRPGWGPASARLLPRTSPCLLYTSP